MVTRALLDKKPDARRLRARTRNVYTSDLLLRIYVGAVLLFIFSPQLIVFITSISSTSVITFPPPGVSLRWFEKLFGHLINAPGLKPQLAASILFSLRLAATVTVLALICGVSAALALHRHQFPGKNVYRQLVLLPMIFPQIVNGVSLLILFSTLRVFSAFERILIGHVLVTLPLVIVAVGSSVEVYEEEVEEAARGLGAGPMQVLVRITLPLIMPGIIAGAVLAFISSLTQFTLSYFLYSGESKPLPIWLLEYIETFFDPTIAAISTCLIFVALLVAFIVDRIIGIERIFAKR